jgi:DUF917 family protein
MSFLGTGGGGNPYIGRLMLTEELRAGREPRIIELSEVPDDWLVVFCVTIGSPSVLLEKFPSVTTALTGLCRLEQRLGRKVDALVLGEAGGINGILPLVIGARSNLPVINADGMGRAFPELPMVTFNFMGCSGTPLVLSDDLGQTAVLDAIDNLEAERLARHIVTAMGAAAHLVAYPMSGAEVKRTAIPGALSFALQIGNLLTEARAAKDDPLRRFIERLAQLRPERAAELLYEGKITDLSRQTAGSFAVGRVIIEAADEPGAQMTIDFQNEFTLARRQGRVVAMVPDLIVIVDRETAEPITTENLKYGQRVGVAAVAAPNELRTQRALEFVGPRAFHIDLDFVPLEDLRTVVVSY